MSTFPHILPATSPDSRQNEGEPAGFPDTQAGLAGLFEKLMAQALSPNPTKSPEPGNQNPQSQISFQTVGIADIHSNKAPAQANTQQDLKSYSNTGETINKRSMVWHLNAIQPDSQNSSRSLTKATGLAKTDKSLHSQGESVTINVSSSLEFNANQFIAAAIPLLGPVTQPNPKAPPVASTSSSPQSAIKPAITGTILPQGNPASASTTKIAATIVTATPAVESSQEIIPVATPSPETAIKPAITGTILPQENPVSAATTKIAATIATATPATKLGQEAPPVAPAASSPQSAIKPAMTGTILPPRNPVSATTAHIVAATATVAPAVESSQETIPVATPSPETAIKPAITGTILPQENPVSATTTQIVAATATVAPAIESSQQAPPVAPTSSSPQSAIKPAITGTILPQGNPVSASTTKIAATIVTATPATEPGQEASPVAPAASSPQSAIKPAMTGTILPQENPVSATTTQIVAATATVAPAIESSQETIPVATPSSETAIKPAITGTILPQGNPAPASTTKIAATIVAATPATEPGQEAPPVAPAASSPQTAIKPAITGTILPQGNPAPASTTKIAATIVTATSATEPGQEASPVAPAASSPQSAIKPAITETILPQENPVSTATTKIVASAPSEDRVMSTVQAVATPQASQPKTKAAELSAKHPEEASIEIGNMANGSSKAAFVSGPENSPSRNSDSNAGVLTQSQSASNGTFIANLDMPMKQAEKTNKIAGQTEKVLPGNDVSGVRGGSARPYSPPVEQLTEAVATGNPVSGNVDGATVLPTGSTAQPIAANLRDDTLERTQELMALNAVRLSDSGNSSMQVVIKPDAGTQLSLGLRQHGGSVEVQAVLQQGDFNHLSQQWPDLQQRLDQRGVRLAPLSDEGASANNNSSGQDMFQQRQNQPAEIVTEIALADAPAGIFAPETVETPAHRGWETWA